MDSETGNESGDYSYDESSDEVEYSSDRDEEYTASFEKISTTRRNLRKGNFNPRLFSFDSSSCELSSTIKNLALETPLDFFKLFFDRRLLETIVKETNRFHANSAWTSYRRTAPWIDTTINEMYTFLATVMLMPHSKKNRICDYWSTDHLIATPIFAELFTRNRFRALLTNLHFNKNQNQIVKDSLYKIQSIIDELKKRVTTDGSASHSNTIQLPLRRLSTSKDRCCVCNIYFSESKSPCSLIKQSARFNMLLTHNVFIPNGTTCCRKHLHDDEFKSDAIILMKKGPNMCAISDHEPMELLNDTRTSFNELQSLLTKARSRLPIDFDDDQMTTDQYLNLTGISKENFFDLCSHIPSTSLGQTSLRSARQSIGCLLVKLRLGLSNQTLASLFSLLDRRTVSRVIDSARTAIIKHFVPKYLGFSHLTRRELIDNHTRPLAKLLFDQPGEDKAIIILDGTYIYVQKSGNNLLQRRTYSLHKDRALIKPMMFVSTDS
ncbi:unnamed protein product [Rotaria sordida]|uniref:PiggyBac transposable element-derived protein domain-containing protein n=1 Tax=Rotaria sordida TaxID=392033 RepID=A0A814S077_9BILA|nr:unnamed protein product [Rotaria sordida]